MSFYQNPFNSDFIGTWVLADRKHIPDYKIAYNYGRGDIQATAWAEGPYDLTGNDGDGNPKDELTIIYAIDIPSFKKWASLTIDIGAGAAVSTAVTAHEIVSNLNANATFAGLFTAVVERFQSGEPRVTIKALRDSTKIKFYIGMYDNSGSRPYFRAAGGAETELKFNFKAGVGEAPTYFDRHTIDQRYDLMTPKTCLFCLTLVPLSMLILLTTLLISVATH